MTLKIATLAFLIIIPLALTLKASEAGVNDWHINSLGELKDVSFIKNKLVFVGKLGLFGQLDRVTGNLENRIVTTEGERIVNSSEREVIVINKLNQILAYKSSGLQKSVDNRFLVDNLRGIQGNRLISIANHSAVEYLLFEKSVIANGEQLRKTEENEKFVRLVEGKSLGVFLITYSNAQYCIEKLAIGTLFNKVCLKGEEGSKLEDVLVLENHIVLSLTQNTIILNSELKEVKRIQEKLIERVKQVLILEHSNFDLDRLETTSVHPIKCSRADSSASIVSKENDWVIVRDGAEIGSIPKKRSTKILRAWLHYKSEVDFELVIQFSDLELSLFELSRGVFINKWKKEESLAYINKVVFMKFTANDGLDNEYHRNLISQNYKDLSFIEKLALLPRDILLRLAEEIDDVKNLFVGLISQVIHLVKEFQGESYAFKMSREQQVHYGLRKYILVLTDWSTVIALDTKNKEVIWKISNDHDSNDKIISFIKLQKDYETEAAIRISFNNKKKIINLEQIHENGVITHLRSYESEIEPTIHKLNDHSIALKIGNIIEKYDYVESHSLQKHYYFYSIEDLKITGWKTEGQGVVETWNFFLPAGYRIAGSAAAFRGEQKSHIPLYEDDKVYFKNVDFTNLAILGVKNVSTIELYILNGQTGHVQFNQFKTSVDTTLPLNLVYDQNNVLVTYFNARNKFYEIWTVEEYNTKIENSPITMIANYLANKEFKPEQNRDNIIFESDLYGSPVSIKKMFISESKMSLIRRNMMVITKENKLYSIGRELISARRPHKEIGANPSFFQNVVYPEYAYFLPFSPANYFSYDVVLHDLQNMRFSSTDMESSIFVFAFGIDSFLIRIAPDRTFDMLTEDFNQKILILILVAVTALILFFRRMVKLAKLKKPHLQ